MKRTIQYSVLLTGFILVCLSPVIGQEDWRRPVQSWEETLTTAGAFRVLAPGAMREKADTLETDIGTLLYHTFFYQPPEGQDENQLYLVSYCDYPLHTVHSDSTDLLPEFFEASVEAASFSIDGEVRYANPVDYFEYPGYIWRIDYLNGKAVIKTRVYLIGRRLYTLQVVTFREFNLNPNIDKFMDSFRLVDP